MMASNVTGEELLRAKQVELEAAIIASGEIRLLANKMNSAGLMSDSDHCDITAVGTVSMNDKDKAGSIVRILRNKVGINQDHFKKFIEILKSDSAFSDILDVLKMKENKVTSVQPQESIQNIHLTPDIKEDLEQQLERNFEIIVKQYADFVSCVCKSIDNNRDVNVENLRLYLLNMSAFDHDNQQIMLLSDVRNELQEAATVHAIFEFLSLRFASFLNYDIFRCIVQEFGNDKDHKKLEDYTARLEEYVNKHKISEFFDINPALKEHDKTTKEHDKTAKKLILKVDLEKFQKLAKITNLKRALAKIWDLKTSAVQFYGIEDGCILVIFLVPVCVADVIFVEENRSTILKQAGCFQALSVQWLECDGFKVYFERSSPDDIKDSEEGVSDFVLESIDPSLTVKKNLPLAGTTLSEQSPFYKDESSTDSTDPPSSKYEGTTISTEKSPSKDESITNYTDPPSSKDENTTMATELSLSKDKGTTDYTDLPSYESTTISTELSLSKDEGTTDYTDPPSSKYEDTTITTELSLSKDEGTTDYTDLPSYEGTTVSTELSLSKDEGTTDYTDPPSSKDENTTIATELSLSKDKGYVGMDYMRR